MTIEQILTEAMQLPTPSRAFVAERLLESLDYQEDVELSEEWLVEIRRRIATIEAGNAQMIPNRSAEYSCAHRRISTNVS